MDRPTDFMQSFRFFLYLCEVCKEEMRVGERERITMKSDGRE